MSIIDHPTNALGDQTIAAAIEVHRTLGPGLLESSYHACLSHELTLRGIKHANRIPVPLSYKGMEQPHAYIADLIVENQIILEIKSIDALKPVHIHQLLTYMRLLRVSAGLLINFNVSRLATGIRRRLL